MKTAILLTLLSDAALADADQPWQEESGGSAGALILLAIIAFVAYLVTRNNATPATTPFSASPPRSRPARWIEHQVNALCKLYDRERAMGDVPPGEFEECCRLAKAGTLAVCEHCASIVVIAEPFAPTYPCHNCGKVSGP